MINRVWENPQVFGINKLPYRSTSWPASQESIRSDKFLYDIDDWRLSLNGPWQVKRFGEPDQVPEDFFTNNSTDGNKTVEFPCNFEMQGLGTPIYSNQAYPFKVDPPRVMGEVPKDWTYHNSPNPTFCCIRNFNLPTNWKDRRIRLYLGAVQSAVFVYVDGKEVGYSQNSMSPAEFDITSYLQESKPGSQHTLGLKVLTLCDGTYLEDQDFWRLSGVFRDTFLYSLNPIHLEHIQISSELDIESIVNDPRGKQLGSGFFHMDVGVWNESDKEEIITLSARVGKAEKRKKIKLEPGQTQVVYLKIPLKQIETWHPENPALHTITIGLEDELDTVNMDRRFSALD